jgi:hypothetical protein
MRSTFQNSGMSLSIGIFFSLMVAGLASTLPRTLTAGLHGQGVPLAVAASVAHLPPVSTMFAALLGYNPIHNLLDPTGVLKTLSAKQIGVLTGKQFFPDVISAPFHHGLVIVFTAAAVMSFIGALISLLRGKQFYYSEPGAAKGATAAAGAPAPASGRAASALPANGQRNGMPLHQPSGAASPSPNGAAARAAGPASDADGPDPRPSRGRRG